MPALPAQLSGAEQFEAVRFASQGLAAVRRAGARLCQAVDDLDDTTMRGSSGLPGWTRGHVVSHLARNADGLVNLLHWARTGIESPMYASLVDREADIQEGADRLARVQQEDLRAADERFFMAAEVMSDLDWEARITNAHGRAIGIALVPWMRLTEMLVHYVDLGVGADFDTLVELAGEQLDGLADHVVTRFEHAADTPPIQLVVQFPSGAHRTWLLGHAGSPTEIRLGAAQALAWLTGRPCPVPGLPRLPAWG